MQTTAPTTTTATFTHTYRPAHVSGGNYSNQRRFGEPNTGRQGAFPHSQKNKPRCHTDGRGQVTVYRDAEDDEAEVTINIGIHTHANATVALNADQLRKLACALLDAAADIENNPARTLANTPSKAAA